jgi:hypothetical protein
MRLALTVLFGVSLGFGAPLLVSQVVRESTPRLVFLVGAPGNTPGDSVRVVGVLQLDPSICLPR